MNVLQIIEKSDFIRISDKPEEKLADLITKTLEKRFGESTIKGIMEEASRINKKSYEEILLNPIMFFTTFEQIFGEPATEVITRTLEKDLNKQGIFIPADRLLDNLLNEIAKKDIIMFIQNLQGQEHILYLWETSNSRKTLLSQYFSTPTNATKGVVAINDDEFVNIESITYHELEKDKSQALAKECSFIDRVYSSNKSNSPTLFASEDCTWWFKQGLTNQVLEIEELLESFFKNNLWAYVCSYDINEIPSQELLKRLLSSHNYIILENPPIIFKRTTV